MSVADVYRPFSSPPPSLSLLSVTSLSLFHLSLLLLLLSLSLSLSLSLFHLSLLPPSLSLSLSLSLTHARAHMQARTHSHFVFSRSTAHSELPDLHTTYKNIHRATPDNASLSSVQNVAMTSSRHNIATTFVGLQHMNVNLSGFCDACADRRHNHIPPNARKALEGATFIAKQLDGETESKRVS